MKTPLTMRGFTLLETLIAVSILAIAIAGPIFVANRAIVAAQIARDQMTASYLAQEGIEYVRLMRDNEYLSFYRAGGANVSSAAWTDFVSGSSAASITSCKTSTCTFDPARTLGTGSNLSLTTCSGSSCAPLHLSGGAYTQTTAGSVTPFTRTIQATDVSSTEEKIVSKVAWQSHGTTYSVTVTDHLTAWQ